MSAPRFSLEYCRRAVTKRGVKPLIVVEADVSPQTVTQLVVIGKVSTMYDLGFEGVKEGFGVGVVGWRATPSHALTHAESSEAVTQDGTRVFTTTVTMEDEPGLGLTLSEGLVEGGPGQLSTPHAPHTPTEETPRVLVHDHGQKTPPPPRPQGRHVAHPDLTRSLRLLLP
jgi:hypothetical protein